MEEKDITKVEDTQPITEEKEEKEEVKKEEKRFTQEELDDIIQKRLDRAMKKAEEERKQAEELAKLSEKERAEKKLELKEQELERERKEFQKERLELQTTKELDKIGLPIAFTDFVIGSNAEETHERIKLFNELWETELDKRRIDAMKGKTPTKGTTSQSMTKEEFGELTHTQRQNLYNENRELYNQLVK